MKHYQLAVLAAVLEAFEVMESSGEEMHWGRGNKADTPKRSRQARSRIYDRAVFVKLQPYSFWLMTVDR